MWWLQCCTLL
ncbi:hypothetical protein RJ639_025538 [Escallonia herrerae]|uniref:Uncharacterized protein n=1 Tax=Escallonia herrerae TaxID=1293975 RepID=A0AA88UTA5_9ASTE|nr:hypothetical protein RJ639_025538 [Escallonia herrerae]